MNITNLKNLHIFFIKKIVNQEILYKQEKKLKELLMITMLFKVENLSKQLKIKEKLGIHLIHYFIEILKKIIIVSVKIIKNHLLNIF